MGQDALQRLAVIVSVGVVLLTSFCSLLGCSPRDPERDAASETLRSGASLQLPKLDPDPLTGPRANFPKDWNGKARLKKAQPIVVMPGHADAQCPEVGGSGTSGHAVLVRGLQPMKQGMTDELYWALQVASAVATVGKARGLPVEFFDPLHYKAAGSTFNPRCIVDPDKVPTSTWSKGKKHRNAGGYVFEIHFDAYGQSGFGSGLIPQLLKERTTYDEELALEFGRYPLRFRNGLGGPRRGVSLLEIGKLEGSLEEGLRNHAKRSATIQILVNRVVSALQRAHTGLK